MIDIKSEDMKTITEAAAWLRSRGVKAACRNTVWRWTRCGINGVVLETVRIGRWLYTSVQAIERFSARLDGRDPTPTVSARRKREMEAATREAKRMFG